MKKIFLAGLAIVLMVLGPMDAHATLLTYSTRAAFDGAFGSTTLIDFEAQQTGGNLTSYGSSLTVGDVTFTQGDGRLYVLSPLIYNTTGTSSNYLNNNAGVAPVGINFSSSVFAVGMDLGYIAFSPGVTMSINLNNGESFLYNFIGQFTNTGKPLDFVGFSSNTAFTSFTINDQNHSVMIDNLAYSASAGQPIPEPSTMLLLGIGLVGLTGIGRKRLQ